MLSFSLSACGKLPSSNKDGQNTSNIENSLESVEIIPSTDTGISSGEDTSEDKKTLINEKVTGRAYGSFLTGNADKLKG